MRRRWMIRIGLALTAAFLVVRTLNIYGDPVPWSARVPGTVVLSFLRCTKYPPSLDFLLMTLGPALLVMAWFDRRNFSSNNPLIVFGRVPLFYFMGHFLLAHIMAVLFAWMRHGHAEFVLNIIPTSKPPVFPPNYGYSLPVVYLIWFTVVVLMYPACLWFARLKERNRAWWLSYL
jgi:hypothetical protein